MDEPTTGLDPEERIRIRNLLVDFSENRTILFSTHVVEDLVATCNQLAVMKKGQFLYSGSMQELLNIAKGHVWICKVKDEFQARELEKMYHVSAKQYVVVCKCKFFVKHSRMFRVFLARLHWKMLISIFPIIRELSKLTAPS